jgi:hypothetical protein
MPPCSHTRDARRRTRAVRAAALIASAGWLAACATGVLAARPETYPPGLSGPSASVNPMLLNSPGYVPPSDPESLSVVVGRRLNAPLVSMPFSGGRAGIDELGRAICQGLHHEDRDFLHRLCVREDEFTGIMWREFPQSRPATGATAGEAWYLLGQRNHGGISRALGDYAGQDLRFVRWERADTIAVYRNFRLHNGLTMVVTDERGAEQRLDVVRSIAERKGVFKLYSLHD